MDTDERMPKVAMGAWSWGAGVAGGDQVFGNHLGESDLQPIFDAAMERGLNLWDTATVYGMGASEDILGRFIRQGNKKDAVMVLEQGALSGKYDTKHPFPEGSDRARIYNPVLAQLEELTAAMEEIGKKHGLSAAQVGTAWAVSKGVLPIIGVTKVRHVEDAAKAASVILSAEEMNHLETLADKAEVNTIREWEKKMD